MPGIRGERDVREDERAHGIARRDGTRSVWVLLAVRPMIPPARVDTHHYRFRQRSYTETKNA